MRKFVFIILLNVGIGAFAQKNLVFFELGGNGGLSSLNYERQITTELGLSARIGLGVSPFTYEKEIVGTEGNPFSEVNFPDFDVVFTIPVSLHYFFDLKKNNYLEVGFGDTWQAAGRNTDAIHVLHGSLGFRRYFGKSKKWMWKANILPILGVLGDSANIDKNSEIPVWGGLAIGKRF